MLPAKILVDNIEIKNNFEYFQGSEVASFFESKGLNGIKKLKILFLEDEVSGVLVTNSGNTTRYKIAGNLPTPTN